MDSSTLTHVAAILVGVLLTSFLLGGGGKQSAKESEPSAANASASSNNKASNKKKKKKNKTNKGESETQPAAKEEPAPAPTPAPAEGGGKKKKKSKGGAAATTSSTSTNGNAAKENGSKENQQQKQEKEQTKKDTNGSAAAAKPKKQQQQQVPPQPMPKQEEEEWITQPVKGKRTKKPKAPKPAAPAAVAAAAPVPVGAAAAGPTATGATPAAPAAPAAPSHTESVTVDAKKVGIIIGPKGATMKAIEEAAGCKLDVNAPAKDETLSMTKRMQGQQTTATVVISADDKESAKKAKKAIQELATKGYATLLQPDNFGEYSISVHPRSLSEIVGPGGNTIKALQSTLDVKINIPPTDYNPKAIGQQVQMAKVGIAGSKDNAKQCKEAIQQLMQYHHHEITHPGFIHEETYIPTEFYHCIIGPRGSEIKHIKGNFKVEVYMPNDESTTENVLVVGRQSNVERAINYMQKLIDRDTEQREKKYADEFY